MKMLPFSFALIFALGSCTTAAFAQNSTLAQRASGLANNSSGSVRPGNPHPGISDCMGSNCSGWGVVPPPSRPLPPTACAGRDCSSAGKPVKSRPNQRNLNQRLIGNNR